MNPWVFWRTLFLVFSAGVSIACVVWLCQFYGL